MNGGGGTAAPAEAAQLDAELADYLGRLATSVAAVAGEAPDLHALRRGARAARLQAARGGPPMSPVALTIDGMRARLYQPTAARGLIIYLHGGGWVLLDLDTHDHILRTLAQLTGCAVLGLDHPRAPEVRFPDLPAVCARAIKAAFRHPALSDPAAAGIVLAGDSSGANLALSVARQTYGQLAGLLLFYGVYDSCLTRPSYTRYGSPPLLLTPDRMAMFWDHYCAPDLRRHPDAAPLNHAPGALAGLPPAYLCIAGCDVLLDENIEMALRLAADGVAVTTRLDAQAPHGFVEAIGQSRIADAAIADAAAWVRRRFG